MYHVNLFLIAKINEKQAYPDYSAVKCCSLAVLKWSHVVFPSSELQLKASLMTMKLDFGIEIVSFTLKTDQ